MTNGFLVGRHDFNPQLYNHCGTYLGVMSHQEDILRLSWKFVYVWAMIRTLKSEQGRTYYVFFGVVDIPSLWIFVFLPIERIMSMSLSSVRVRECVRACAYMWACACVWYHPTTFDVCKALLTE